MHTDQPLMGSVALSCTPSCLYKGEVVSGSGRGVTGSTQPNASLAALPSDEAAADGAHLGLGGWRDQQRRLRRCGCLGSAGSVRLDVAPPFWEEEGQALMHGGELRHDGLGGLHERVDRSWALFGGSDTVLRPQAGPPVAVTGVEQRDPTFRLLDSAADPLVLGQARDLDDVDHGASRKMSERGWRRSSVGRDSGVVVDDEVGAGPVLLLHAAPLVLTLGSDRLLLALNASGAGQLRSSLACASDGALLLGAVWARPILEIGSLAASMDSSGTRVHCSSLWLARTSAGAMERPPRCAASAEPPPSASSGHARA
eukprot:CAMPEP_0175545904 /NCGR_PEP_ID=MMETSP0096-20121207/29517_1 /TAXON_ID=311494 /ORGANISM="Alexandrium monilatum, Strain CCMP3105" /LENGTH=312 /DNA_ID=CAMNT_0016848871 /DNA_START=113 /DNA_END=1049 /DNA_ORIENTATION=-